MRAGRTPLPAARGRAAAPGGGVPVASGAVAACSLSTRACQGGTRIRGRAQPSHCHCRPHPHSLGWTGRCALWTRCTEGSSAEGGGWQGAWSAGSRAQAKSASWDHASLVLLAASHRPPQPRSFRRAASLPLRPQAIGTLNRRITDADVTPWFSSAMYPKYYMVGGPGPLRGRGPVDWQPEGCRARLRETPVSLLRPPPSLSLSLTRAGAPSLVENDAGEGSHTKARSPSPSCGPSPAPQDNTFHYQSDGWMSSRSAAVYETSTEALFFGRQDAMQRTVLLAMHEWLRDTGRWAGGGARRAGGRFVVPAGGRCG